jgi:hypothetical protein
MELTELERELAMLESSEEDLGLELRAVQKRKRQLKYEIKLLSDGFVHGEIVEYGPQKILVRLKGVVSSGYYFYGIRIKKDGTDGAGIELYREVKKRNVLSEPEKGE